MIGLATRVASFALLGRDIELSGGNLVRQVRWLPSWQTFMSEFCPDDDDNYGQGFSLVFVVIIGPSVVASDL